MMEVVSVSVCLSVCNSILSTTAHPIDFTPCRFIAEDPRKCSVDSEVIRIIGFEKSASFWPVLNRTRGGHCSANVKMK